MTLVQRKRIAWAQAMAIDQLKSCYALQRFKHGGLIDTARCDLPVAILARLDSQLERRNATPERLVAKRLKPFFHIVHVVEQVHGTSLPEPAASMQIRKGVLLHGIDCN